MSDFPQSHTTTTTTTQHTATVTTGRVHLDVAYIKTIPGILRIVEIILCIILFICSVSACSTSYLYGGGDCGWAAFVGFMGFIFVIGWLLFYLFHVQDSAPTTIPWLLIELIFYAIWTFFLIISGITLAVLSANTATLTYGYLYANSTHSSAGAGSFFAFAAAIAFGFQTFFIFREWRAHRIANPRQPMAGHP